MNKKISFKYLWLKDNFDKIRMRYSPEELSNQEIQKYLMEEYDKRYKPVGRFMSNVTCENEVMSLEKFINKIINEDCIVSGYCTLFKNHEHKNIAAEALKLLLDSRKKYKKLMVEYPKGSNEYTYYKVLQLTYKVLANSYYGILGLSVSPFFNSFVQCSTTCTGQDIITTSISSMESFLGNNNFFEDLDDILEFVNNIRTDGKRYNILDYVDRSVSVDELTEYLIKQSKTEIDIDTLYKITGRMDDELRTRVYYKNQLMKLLKNKYFINYYSEKIKEGYSEDEEFRNLVCDFVFYDHILEDRFKRSLKQERNSVIVVDTDSNFLYLNNQVQETLKLLNMEINETNELSAMNMFIDLSTEALKRIFWTLTTNLGIEDDYKEIINMKNELRKIAPSYRNISRITLLTVWNRKKSAASNLHNCCSTIIESK